MTDLVNLADQRKIEAVSDKVKLIKYRRTILNLNKIAKVASKKESTTENNEETPKSIDDDKTSDNKEDKKSERKTAENAKKKKCRYEDKGRCKLGKQCEFFHPRGICQSFSKLGSCTYKNKCGLRHPTGVCNEYESKGNCPRGDMCKFRHPLQFAQKPFLGMRPPPQPAQVPQKTNLEVQQKLTLRPEWMSHPPPNLQNLQSLNPLFLLPPTPQWVMRQ